MKTITTILLLLISIHCIAQTTMTSINQTGGQTANVIVNNSSYTPPLNLNIVEPDTFVIYENTGFSPTIKVTRIVSILNNGRCENGHQTADKFSNIKSINKWEGGYDRDERCKRCKYHRIVKTKFEIPK